MLQAYKFTRIFLYTRLFKQDMTLVYALDSCLDLKNVAWSFRKEENTKALSGCSEHYGIWSKMMHGAKCIRESEICHRKCNFAPTFIWWLLTEKCSTRKVWTRILRCEKRKKNSCSRILPAFCMCMKRNKNKKFGLRFGRSLLKS